MLVKVITAPDEIVSRDEVKRHCKIEIDDDDALVDAYIGAAVAWLDGPAGCLGRALGKQRLEMSGRFNCREIKLLYPPIIGEVEVFSEAADGAETQVDPESYRLVDGKIVVAAPWNSISLHRIRYDAGYVTGAGNGMENSIPKPIVVAIFMLVAHWYEHRESVSSNGAMAEVPMSVQALLAPYRIWSL